MKKCPNCNHKLYGEEKQIRICKYCGYINNPKKLGELENKNEN
jgi:DNA-directed RNA polymerase subunit M/transcription elongation factor TFIIS